MKQKVGLVDRMCQLMAISPQSGAIEFKGAWFSWGDMAAVVQRVDELLASVGQGEGAAVGMFLRNRPIHICAELGVLLSRRCVVTINPFQSETALVNNLQQLRPPVLMMDVQDWGLPRIREACAGSVVVLLETREGRMSLELAPGHERVTAADRHSPLPGIGILMLSSGTTGVPKRIPLAFANLEKAVMSAAAYEAGSGDELKIRKTVAFVPLPLVHIGGLWVTLMNLASGRPVVLFEKFNIPEFEQAMRTHRPKLIPLPPTAIRMVFDANLPKEVLSSLVAIRAGTAPLDPAFAEAFEDRYGVAILDAYGATEFAGGVAGWTWPDYQHWGKEKRGSVGKANQGVQLRVVSPEGEELPHGSVGLLEVRAAQLGETSGWVRTTDLAELDADGFLYIRGRADDAIIRGGFKVLPAEVADALRQHPAVQDASVVGMPDARLGAVPMAAVELRAGLPKVSESDLLEHLRQKLVSYQIPTKIAVVDELPRTPSMKISQPGVKELLQKLLEAEHAAG